MPRFAPAAVLAVLALSCGTLDGNRLYTPIACGEGTADCDGRLDTGCETDLRRPTDCGACGVTCTAAQVCASGACVHR